MVRSFLLMLALLLAIDVPKLGAEIGTGSFVTSAMIGGVTALVQAYRTTKRKYEKKQARKYTEALEAERPSAENADAQVEHAETSDASVEEKTQKIAKPKNFTLRKNFMAMIKNMSPVDFVKGAGASLLSLFIADQCYSFDDIERELNVRWNINLQDICDTVKNTASDTWYFTQWGTRATYAAAEVGCSRAYELLPGFSVGSALRALPLATVVASYKMAKEAYTVACAKEENKHKELSFYRDFPLIWQQRNWKTFKKWFITSGIGLYILDQFVQRERRGLEAAEHPSCPQDHAQARKAYVRAYARHENQAWADQVAQRVRVSDAGSPAAEQAVARELQRLDLFERNEQRRIAIEENYEDMIAEGCEGFIEDFHVALRNTQVRAQQNNKAEVYADMVHNYYLGSYLDNQDYFANYAEQFLENIGVNINYDNRRRLVGAVCRVAHYAAAHRFGRDSRQAGRRAIDQLFAGKSAQCAAGYGIFASTHPYVARALGV